MPFDEPFDLIVCNHVFNHAVRLDSFLASTREALRPGGHLYLYNEIDDSEFLDGGQRRTRRCVSARCFSTPTKFGS